MSFYDSILSPVFGSKPQVAPYVPTSLTEEQQNAISANITSFPDISKLGQQYQDYLVGEYQKLLPGFSDILKSGGQTTQEMLDQSASLLKGEIPQDVQDQIQRSTAYQSLGAGISGSPMARALTARDLGTTSLNLINQGANLQAQAGNAFQRWTGIAGQTIMNPSSSMITPQQQYAAQLQNRLYKQQSQQYKYNIEAAPDPVAKGISDTIINLVGAYLGKGGGGGGTAPNYSATSPQYAGSGMPTGDYGGGIGYTPSAGQYAYNQPAPQYQSYASGGNAAALQGDPYMYTGIY